jgi:drug/metabolite transporter (DMT)-like permease
MSAASLGLLLAGVVLNALGQFLLKAGTNAVGHFDFHLDNLVPVGWKIASDPWIIGGVACYGISLIVWIMGLSRVPVSIAYPLLSLGYVINAVMAHYLLGESVNAQRMIGIGFIILGVVIVARSGH